jgi:putative transposase
MIHSDQGSQFTSREWQMFLSMHNLEASISRSDNREVERQDVFDYIEMFYNPKRKYTNNGML